MGANGLLLPAELHLISMGVVRLLTASLAVVPSMIEHGEEIGSAMKGEIGFRSDDNTENKRPFHNFGKRTVLVE